MIKVEVQNYCQSCLNFEPDVEKPTKFYVGSDVVNQTDTIIRCEYRKRCEGIMRYLNKILPSTGKLG